MATFWQITPTEWINPAHIVHVEDQHDSRAHWVVVRMVPPSTGFSSGKTEPFEHTFSGEARDTFLAYLARETESAPPG